jgi:hypothetical protein
MMMATGFHAMTPDERAAGLAAMSSEEPPRMLETLSPLTRTLPSRSNACHNYLFTPIHRLQTRTLSWMQLTSPGP